MQKDKLEQMIKQGGISGISHKDIFNYLLDLKDDNFVYENLIYLYDKIQKFRLISMDDLLNIDELSEKKRLKFLCLLELSQRIYHKEYDKRRSLFDTEDVYDLIKDEMEYLEQENLVVISMDIKGKIIKKETVYIGTTTSIPVSVKEIFKTPIRMGAYGFIIIHNHPTGDAKPSLADDKLTQKIMDASNLLSIEVIDHIIIGRSEFYSYKNKKLFKV